MENQQIVLGELFFSGIIFRIIRIHTGDWLFRFFIMET